MDADRRLSQTAAALAEPARATMLCALMDGRARTATELAALAGVGAPTASTHLARLAGAGLVAADAQGRHRYFRIASEDVGRAIEALLVVSGAPLPAFRPSTPRRLQAARTCYDHLAGTVAVALHDALVTRGWLQPHAAASSGGSTDYLLTRDGARQLQRFGVDVAGCETARRRFACACIDWSERRPHLGGALGAGLLATLAARRWLERDADSRCVTVTAAGRRGLRASFDVAVATAAHP